ncbi:MAG: hypothetical protein IT561_01830, partial [Alphaproteobacteria bacterium]|nr:hypothetical protein [Alphaproteobacteria bacterium]
MAVTIQALRTFSAGNVVSRDPVIVVRVSVHPSAALGQAVERVAAALPELETGVFPAGADGAAFAHLVAAAAASIMRRLRHPG